MRALPQGVLEIRGIYLRALIGLLLWLMFPTVAAAASPNPIQLENAKPGTTAWEIPAGSSSNIEGYGSEISVAPGDVLHMHVSTAGSASYRIEIFRLGWYGGDGGRRVACLPSCSGDEPGVQQPVPAPDPTTGELDAGWPVTDSLAIGSDWTSGYFVAKLIITSGPSAGQASYIFFIVRALAGTQSKVMVQASVNTWEAYNNWGGKSLYGFNSSNGTAATMVSFNRPFTEGVANTSPLTWEYQLVRYLERNGYDVSYQTDTDTDQNAASLLGHQLDIVSGHDEYWSKSMRDAWDSARDSGVNLAFLGADIGNWQMRYADADRTIVEYRNASLDPNPDPTQKTAEFQQLNPPRPECELLGIEYTGGLDAVYGGPFSYTVTASAASVPMLGGSGLGSGTSLPNSVGYEWDSIKPGCAVPPLTDLMHWQDANQSADAVEYQAPSGAHVFSDGTLNLTYTLDDYGHAGGADRRVQALFAQIFSEFGGGEPAPVQAAPEPLLTAPSQDAHITSPATLRWSVPAGVFSSYVLELDGKARSLQAVCTNGACSANVPVAIGRHQWQILAEDALENSSGSPVEAFTVGPPPSTVSLAAPGPGATLWAPAPSFTWTRSHALASPVRYVLVVDGRAALTTSVTNTRLPFALGDGWHRWQVEAIANGSIRRSATRRFRVQSVRLLQASRSMILRRGLGLRVYCVRRCVVTVSVRTPRHSRVLQVGRRRNPPGIHRVVVKLGRRGRFFLVSAAGKLFLAVQTRTRATTRTVGVVFSW